MADEDPNTSNNLLLKRDSVSAIVHNPKSSVLDIPKIQKKSTKELQKGSSTTDSANPLNKKRFSLTGFFSQFQSANKIRNS